METHVHLVAYNSKLGAVGVLPEDLLGAWSSAHATAGIVHRVVELRDPAPGQFVADLCTSERELPEVISVLRGAREIHLHGMAPRLGLHMLPYIKPELLADVTLVVHGPWPRVTASVDSDGTRFGAWPGPVVFDQLARSSHTADLEAEVPVDHVTADKANPAEDRPSRLFVDVARSDLLPRPGDPVPHDGTDADGPVVAVALSAEFGETAREALIGALSQIELTGLAVELWDERGFESRRRTPTRRHAQACIAPVRFHWSASRTVLEAMAQRVPVIAFGETEEATPPGVTYAASAQDVADTLVAWAEAWRQRKAAPTEVDAARAWLLERLAA